MKDYPEAPKLMVSPDRGIYSFPDINDCYHCRASNGRALLNTEWLRKVGLAMPQTTDEFREVLTAFKKADLAGGGKTIPFGGYKDAPLDTFFMNSFLYNAGDPWLAVNDGKVEANYVKDEWREDLQTCAACTPTACWRATSSPRTRTRSSGTATTPVRRSSAARASTTGAR